MRHLSIYPIPLHIRDYRVLPRNIQQSDRLFQQYECGVFERIQGWLESLGVKYEGSPPLEGCLMHQRGKCHRTYKLYYDK